MKELEKATDLFKKESTICRYYVIFVNLIVLLLIIIYLDKHLTIIQKRNNEIVSQMIDVLADVMEKRIKLVDEKLLEFGVKKNNEPLQSKRY